MIYHLLIGVFIHLVSAGLSITHALEPIEEGASVGQEVEIYNIEQLEELNISDQPNLRVTLKFRPGIYVFKPAGRNSTFLHVKNIDHLRLVGDGLVVFQLDDSAIVGTSTKLLRLEGVKSLEVSGIRFQGAYSSVGEGIHGKSSLARDKNTDSEALRELRLSEGRNFIHVRGAHKGAYIHDCEFDGAPGDSINISDSRNVFVMRNRFGPSGRNGLTLGGQAGSERVAGLFVSDNIFSGEIDTQRIDFELHGDGLDDLDDGDFHCGAIIYGNRFPAVSSVDELDWDQYMVSMTSVKGVFLSSNDMHGGLYMRNASNAYIYGNSGEIFVHGLDSSEVFVNNNKFDYVERYDRRAGKSARVLVRKKRQYGSVAIESPDVFESLSEGADIIKKRNDMSLDSVVPFYSQNEGFKSPLLNSIFSDLALSSCM